MPPRSEAQPKRRRHVGKLRPSCASSAMTIDETSPFKKSCLILSEVCLLDYEEISSKLGDTDSQNIILSSIGISLPDVRYSKSDLRY